MPPKEHYLAQYFEKTKEKANKTNVFSICKFCINGLGHEIATKKSKITHKSRDCKNHLESCQFFLAEYSYEKQQEILDPQNETIESYSTNIKKRKLDSKNLNKFFKSNFQGEHLEQYEKLLIRATVSRGWSFRWIEDPEVQDLIRFLNPAATFPNRLDLSNRILNHETEMVLENIVQSATQMILVLHYHGSSLPWNVEDLSNKRKNWQTVVLMTKNLFNSIEARGILINELVTDSAPEYMAASRLKDEQATVYKGKYIALITPNYTRWNSHFYCFSSILKSKAALKNLMTKIEDGDDSSLYGFPIDIQENLSSSDWWRKLQELYKLIEPYCAALNKLQTDGARLHEVLYAFGWIRYRAGKNPFDQVTYNQFDDPLEFWNYIAVLKICQIRDKLRRERLKEALAKQEKTIRETNVAQQAQNTDLENEEISDIKNEIFNTSEDTDIEELNESNSEDEFKNCTGDVQSVENWRYLVSRWTKLVDEEENNQDEINANNELVDNNSLDDDNFFDEDFGTTHPAENREAKWKLSDLFTDLLEQPAYLSLLIE
ncbi:hypothetical protein C2G38_2157358 [Gigaspora rosea]|uniref:DUF659 domain-containing protein n=1 Tax=Gigaspora rosea TaxID=44941 RepID=A0A397W1L6_9GLOM|nr:hypothetical protein C2G38_2157358 [Gigaspora rosea]